MKKQRVSEASLYLFVILCTAILGYASLGKGFDFQTVNSLSGDGVFGLMLTKSIQEHGIAGIWMNSRVGAPEISSLINYPVLDYIMAAIIWIVSLFTSSTAAIMYIYLIITFVLDGIAMVWLLRKLKVRKILAFTFGVLFACAPYHFYRYLGHSTLINYTFFPLAMYLVCYILGVIEEKKKWKLITAIGLIGFGYGYYYAFSLIMLAVAYLVKFIKAEEKRSVLEDLWIIGLLLLFVFIGLLPKIIDSKINGANLEVGVRYWAEQETYGLKIIQLLLPVSYSRVELLREITTAYNMNALFVTENGMSSLGLVGSLGFVVQCGLMIFSFLEKKKSDNAKWLIIDYISLTVLVFILMGTVGGFGEIFNMLVTAQIRCYNRSSIALTGFSLLILALLLNNIKIRSRYFTPILSVVVLFIGLYDQVCIYPDHWQEPLRAEQAKLEKYFSEVEASLPENAMVYQLPYMDFPETGSVNGMTDYEPFVGYLFTDTIRWSYGGVRGRDNVAEALYVDQGMSVSFLKGIQDAGFDAVYIDRRGYSDDGNQIISFYNNLGLVPKVSENDRYYIYDISHLEINEHMLKPGFLFVKDWADHYGILLEEQAMIQIAEGIGALDTSAMDILYSGISERDIVKEYSDAEYSDFLYAAVLRRTINEPGQATWWIEQLQNGLSRKDAFYFFLSCEEFRNLYGFTEG